MIRRLLLPAFVVLYFMCSLYAMLAFMSGAFVVGYSGLDVGYSNGPQVRPFVYRVLVPIVAKAVMQVVPDTIETSLTEKMIRWRDSAEGKEAINSLLVIPPPFVIPPALANENLFETAVVVVIVYLTLLAFIGMLYMLARALFPESLIYALVAPLVALQIIPAVAVYRAYIYDFAELFFSCACCYLLFQRRWGRYIACLAVATLNKETTIFEVFFYAVWFYSRLPRTQYVRLLLYQLAVYAAVKGAVTWYFADMPGGLLAHYFVDILTYTYQYMYEIGLTLIVIAFAVCYKWQEKPAFLRGGMWIVLVNVGAYFIGGFPGEYRDLYFCMPIVMLLGTHTLVRISGLQDVPLFLPKRPPSRIPVHPNCGSVTAA